MMFRHSTPIPSTQELRDVVHEAPAKCLHPSLPADRFYHLVMKEKLWRSRSGDSFSIYHYEQHDAPFEVDIQGKIFTLRDKMVLRDRTTGAPVAILLHMHWKWESTFKIYGFVPYYDFQSPSANQRHEGRDLYEWAVCKNRLFSVRKTLCMVDGVSYVMDGVGPIMTAYRQIRITRDGVPCLYGKAMTMGLLTGNQWELQIGPGIDPVVMVAFMAIIDEMNEE